MIVVDASVILHVLTNAPTSESIIARLQGEDELVAPHLIDLEVLNGLRKNLLTKRMSREHGELLFKTFANWQIERLSVLHLAKQIWSLHENITPYDASYVCLAGSLDVVLVTRDGKLSSAAGKFAKIELI